MRIQKIGKSDRTPWGADVYNQFKGDDDDCVMNKDKDGRWIDEVEAEEKE